MVTTTSPPGTRTVSVPVSAPAWASAANAAATVPVPHERVSPTPRSWTRIWTDPPTDAASTSTLTPSGNWARSNCTGAATSRAASSSTLSRGSTHARCGLPTVMQRHQPGAGQCSDDELVAGLQAAGAQVVGEHPHAVAAHLRGRPVGVAIVHVPVVRADAVGQALEHTGRHGGAGGGKPQHPLGAPSPA